MMTTRMRVIAVLATLAVSLYPLGVSGYVLRGLKWGTLAVALSLKLGAPKKPLTDGSTSWDEVALAAAKEWNKYTRLQLSKSTKPAGKFGRKDRINSVVWMRLDPTTLAKTHFWYYVASKETFDFDIALNRNYRWDSYRGTLANPAPGAAAAVTKYDARRVLLHELGHLLGLKHPDDYGQKKIAIMNSLIAKPTSNNIDRLKADDIAGGRRLYGKK